MILKIKKDETGGEKSAEITKPKRNLMQFIFWVVVVAVLMVGGAFKNKIDDGFKCPNDYGSAEEYLNSVAQMIKTETDKNPEISFDELMNLRNEELDAHKCEPSKWMDDGS